MQRELPTGTVTFLFTDVEGSTNLLHSLGAEAYAEALADHRRIIRAACTSEGGVEVDTQGDAFFFAFPTAPGAVAAASSFVAGLASGPIQVRVGLHTGTPLLAEEGYVGTDVHRAARIGASGHGGQVLVSASTAPLVELELLDLGEHRFKDLAAPERVYQLGDGEFPPLKTLYRTNLPVPATPFVGREAELAEVVALVTSGDLRLLTLTGPGGTGKTRLALQAVAEAAESFPDGAFWVPLAPLRDPALVSATIAQALGAKDTLATHIQDREMLLLLDNLEQVIDSVRELSDLLSACPNLTLLVTSRELLRASGEVEYAVPPLSSVEAVSLFCQRAQLAPSEDIADLCARLDNLPLAVELAAARTSALAPAQITDRLSGRLDLLEGGRDADPRQQTLMATIEWSYDLLSRDEQELFARLAIFSGGCTLEAAEEVAEADLDPLRSLVEKSLVRFSNRRYWMLVTIREYAAETLSRRSADDLAHRHLDYYLARAREFDDSPGTQIDLDQVDAEHDNFRLAMDTAFASRPGDAVELVGCLGQYWIERGHFFEGRARAAAALDVAADVPSMTRARVLRVSASIAAKQDEFEEAERLGREALGIYRAEDDARGAAGILTILGIAAWYQGNLDEATRLFEEALREYDALQESVGAGESGVARARHMVMGNLAGVAAAAGDHARAIELGREVVSVERGRSDFALAVALNSLGLALEKTGQAGEARECFEEAIALSRARGFTEALAYVLASLAHLEIARAPLAAFEHFQESLALMRAMGTPRGVYYCLEGLGAVALSDGRAVDAATLLGAASSAREKTGVPLDADELAEVSRWVGEVRETLGAEAFEASWSRGSTLSVDEAVELGLSLSEQK